MEDGEVVKWLRRIDVIYKEKAIWKSQVVLEDCDRSKFSVTCQWYSPIVGLRDPEYTFQEVRDRQRYSPAHFIGLVRIDSDSDEGGIYHISEKLNTALNEALEGTLRKRKQAKGKLPTEVAKPLEKLTKHVNTATPSNGRV